MGNAARGICSLPYVRHSDGETVYFPYNLIENLYVSNGMSAGNTLAEAQVQCLSEIFERAVKREILEGEIALPDVAQDVLAKYPGILAGIAGLEEQGFPVLVKDASLGGMYPLMCVSWRFFSARADYDFVEWDFSGHGDDSNAEEAATLFGILADMGKEAYTAVYDQLGAVACRILVPGNSEVYPVEDLIWENTNKALLFRADVLNLHRLDDASLEALLDRLENSELDDYGDIATLIGIEFDENTDWGQLTVLELKLLINLALKQFEEAHELVGAFLQYNDNSVERKLFYQALNVVLEVVLDEELELDDYAVNFRRMFGDARMDAALGSVDGSVRFHGLTPTSMQLEGLDRHQRLIDSLRKLHAARARAADHRLPIERLRLPRPHRG